MKEETKVSVIQWRKSSFSNGQYACVEVASLGAARWRKSSRSNAQTSCVEVADLNAAMAVRDSKDPDGPVLLFSAPQWHAFVTSLRTGEFDQN